MGNDAVIGVDAIQLHGWAVSWTGSMRRDSDAGRRYEMHQNRR